MKGRTTRTCRWCKTDYLMTSFALKGSDHYKVCENCRDAARERRLGARPPEDATEQREWRCRRCMMDYCSIDHFAVRRGDVRYKVCNLCRETSLAIRHRLDVQLLTLSGEAVTWYDPFNRVIGRRLLISDLADILKRQYGREVKLVYKTDVIHPPPRPSPYYHPEYRTLGSLGVEDGDIINVIFI